MVDNLKHRKKQGKITEMVEKIKERLDTTIELKLEELLINRTCMSTDPQLGPSCGILGGVLQGEE